AAAEQPLQACFPSPAPGHAGPASGCPDRPGGALPCPPPADARASASRSPAAAGRQSRTAKRLSNVSSRLYSGEIGAFASGDPGGGTVCAKALRRVESRLRQIASTSQEAERKPVGWLALAPRFESRDR